MAQLYNLLYIVRYTPLILTLVTGSFADKIGPKDEDANIVGKETDTVTLKCSYESSSNTILLYWYKQYPNSAPQFLLYKGTRSAAGYDSTPDDHRLESTTSRDSTELTIRGLKLSDSALYHCALRAYWVSVLGVYSDPLLFGKPINLTVKPKNVQEFVPKLSILSSYGNNEKWDTCLAAAFSPKEGTLSLSLENKKSVMHTVDNAVMSKDGTYYFATFSEDAIETCQMKGISANKGPGQSPDCGMTDVTKSPTVVFDVTNSTEILKPETKTYSGDPKGNTMQLFVTGLRLLLAKAVGVNILMTFKAFLV